MHKLLNRFSLITGIAVLAYTSFLFVFRQAEWWYIDPSDPPGSVRRCEIKLTIWKPKDLIPYAERIGPWSRREDMWTEAPAKKSYSRFGIDYVTFGRPYGSSLLLTPIWPTTLTGLLTGTLAITPAARSRLRQLLTLRRAGRNYCTKCNYNLRAHHPGDACPECGTPVPSRPAIIPDEKRSIP